MKTIKTLALAGLAIAALALPAFAAEPEVHADIGTLDEATAEGAFPARPIDPPFARRNAPRRPSFGDTHLHASISVEAGAFGCRLTPIDACRVARGEEITAYCGQQAKLSRPSDSLVVADHSDGQVIPPS